MQKLILTKDQKVLHKIFAATFDLTKTQAKLLVKLIYKEDGLCCINQITDDKDTPGRSTIQKYMKVLLDKGLITRSSKTINEFKEICQSQNRNLEYQTSGGYIYVYEVDVEHLIEKAESQWAMWKNKIVELLS